jgi:hypothetical protein
MLKYVSAGLLAVALASGAYSLYLRQGLAEQELALAVVTRERDNLQNELSIAKTRLAQSIEAQNAAAESLVRAQYATRELAAIKDWIRGNEDAPVPEWFNDLLVRLGFGLREPICGSPNPSRPRRNSIKFASAG